MSPMFSNVLVGNIRRAHCWWQGRSCRQWTQSLGGKRVPCWCHCRPSAVLRGTCPGLAPQNTPGCCGPRPSAPPSDGPSVCLGSTPYGGCGRGEQPQILQGWWCSWPPPPRCCCSDTMLTQRNKHNQCRKRSIKHEAAVHSAFIKGGAQRNINVSPPGSKSTARTETDKKTSD